MLSEYGFAKTAVSLGWGPYWSHLICNCFFSIDPLSFGGSKREEYHPHVKKFLDEFDPVLGERGLKKSFSLELVHGCVSRSLPLPTIDDARVKRLSQELFHVVSAMRSCVPVE